MLKEILTAMNNSNVDTANETSQFEVGKTYYAADFAGEWSEDAPVIVKTLNVIKRTAKTLTAIDENGNQVLKRISLAYAGTKETVVVSGVNDIDAQTVHIYSDKEYTPAVAAAPTDNFNAWLEAITNGETAEETAEYTPQCTWVDAHDYETAGNLNGEPRAYNLTADEYANIVIIGTAEEYAVNADALQIAINAEICNANFAGGNYSEYINGEYVSFKNHSIVRIDAGRKLGMEYSRINGKKYFRLVSVKPGAGGYDGYSAPTIDKKKKPAIIIPERRTAYGNCSMVNAHENDRSRNRHIAHEDYQPAVVYDDIIERRT